MCLSLRIGYAPDVEESAQAREDGAREEPGTRGDTAGQDPPRSKSAKGERPSRAPAKPGVRPVDPGRLRTGEVVALVSAILLVVFMLFDWFGSTVTEAGGTYGNGRLPLAGDAWNTLDVAPYVLLLIVIVVVGNSVRRATAEPAPSRYPPSAFVTLLGALGALMILYRIVDPPGETVGAGVNIDVGTKAGIWLSLIAALGIAIGGWLTMREEDASITDLLPGERGHSARERSA
jgi:hypothetical protein